MKEIVINACHGGFGLSNEAFREFCKRKEIPIKEHTESYGGGHSLTNLWGVLGPNDDPTTTSKGGDLLSDHDIERDDPVLIKLVREMKKKVNGMFANLKVVKIPNDVEWEIKEYDGAEWVAEKHRVWS